MSSVAFLGLGTMGYPMAGHLRRHGRGVVVFNRTAAKTQNWVKEFGGTAAETPALAARDADIVFACVGRDQDVREIILGENGCFDSMRPGSVFVDHTTASAALARELAEEFAKRNLGFVDAPVSGGEKGAKDGQLTVMCGGERSDFDRVAPFITAYAKSCRLMGPAGSGQLTKMVNQICIAGLVEALAEGLNFARAAGLDPFAVVDVISKGAAQSWQMENRHKTMLQDEYNHGFAVEWMRKDLAIVFEEGQRNGAALPVTKMVDNFYEEVERLGGARWDTSSLLKRLESISASASGAPRHEQSK